MLETTHSITTDDGVGLNVTVYAADSVTAAPPVGPRDFLLVHGWPNSGRVWKPFAAAMLTAAGYRLIAPDLRGFGASDRAEHGFTCPQFARDVAVVAAEMGLTDWALVGHSMGGKIAQLAASFSPAGLRALVLVTPGLLAASPPVDVSGRRALFGDAAKVREMLNGWAGRPLPDSTAQALTDDALRVSREAWNGWLSPMRDEDFADAAASINMPTRVIGGGKDPQRTEEELRRDVVGRIAGAEYVRLPNSGHLPHLEEPEALAALTVNFLENLPVKHP